MVRGVEQVETNSNMKGPRSSKASGLKVCVTLYLLCAGAFGEGLGTSLDKSSSYYKGVCTMGLGFCECCMALGAPAL